MDSLIGAVVADSIVVEYAMAPGLYMGVHTQSRRRFAVRVSCNGVNHWPAEICAQYRAAANALASLRHPNLAEVHALSATPDGRIAVVTEPLPGSQRSLTVQRSSSNQPSLFGVITHCPVAGFRPIALPADSLTRAVSRLRHNANLRAKA